MLPNNTVLEGTGTDNSYDTVSLKIAILILYFIAKIVKVPMLIYKLCRKKITKKVSQYFNGRIPYLENSKRAILLNFTTSVELENIFTKISILIFQLPHTSLWLLYTTLIWSAKDFA